MSEMEKLQHVRLFNMKSVGHFNHFVFFLRKTFIKPMEIAQAPQQTSQSFCFQVQKIRLFYV